MAAEEAAGAEYTNISCAYVLYLEFGSQTLVVILRLGGKMLRLLFLVSSERL